MCETGDANQIWKVEIRRGDIELETRPKVGTHAETGAVKGLSQLTVVW